MTWKENRFGNVFESVSLMNLESEGAMVLISQLMTRRIGSEIFRYEDEKTFDLK